MSPRISVRPALGIAAVLLASACATGGLDSMGGMGGRTAAVQMAYAHGDIVPAAAKVATVAVLPRAGWTATASDSQRSPARPPSNALDGNPRSLWGSRLSPAARLPHSITVDMKKLTVVSGLLYLPRQDGNRQGRIGRFAISVSTNGRTFSRPVATGTWADDAIQKTARFASVRTRYVRLTALTEAGHRGPWTTVAELHLLGPVAATVAPAPRPTTRPTAVPTVKPAPKPTAKPTVKPTTKPTAEPTATTGPAPAPAPAPPGNPAPAPSAPPAPPAPAIASTGSWGPVITFPIVPVSAVLLPGNKLLTFSAYSPTTYSTGGQEKTQTAILDLATGVVSQREISNTGQEMFCSGIAVLPDGRVLVNGGSDSGATSIYSPVTNTWTAGPVMNIPRGYEGDTTLSTGQVFTLGGSWNGGIGGKNGEVYTPDGSWALLPNVLATSILTSDDPQGVYREDNQGWFFATANGGVFHAGPSAQMNWFTTTGSGSTTSAGVRGDDADAMNGNAVMYDIGKIFTDGGATAYQNAPASDSAYTIDISRGPGVPVTVTRQDPMTYARAFQESVVLPDGEVLVVGGQPDPVPFTDTDAVLEPELWNPATGKFTVMAAEAVPRTYHSVALLLPDGRVFSGGGGLCGDGCATNHPDGQIFTPPYLLNADGSLRVRPTITAAPTAAAAGDTITVGTGGAVSSFDLVRMGAVTHTVDSDQRRIPVTSTATASNSYRVTIPASTGTVVPGNYMLFAFNSAGTPSVSRTITIG